MSKKNKEIEVEVEIDDDDLDDLDDLDERIMDQFANSLEREINLIFSQYLAYDGRRELISVLTSIAASLSIDLGLTIDDFVEYSAIVYEESEMMMEDEEKDISTLN